MYHIRMQVEHIADTGDIQSSALQKGRPTTESIAPRSCLQVFADDALHPWVHLLQDVQRLVLSHIVSQDTSEK
jgi:hypothetical protein